MTREPRLGSLLGLAGLVAVGGVIGSLARYGLVLAFPVRSGELPVATLLVNLTGCLALGLLVGIGMASQFVLVLRPIFTLPPPLEVPAFELAVLAALVLGATALSSAVAAALIGRLEPTELLRDE